RLAGVQILLRTEIRGKSDMRLDRGIDQHRPPAPGLDRISSVVATERGTDIARTRTACHVLDDAGRCARRGRQLRAGKPGCQSPLGHVLTQDSGLVRMRRRIEAVEIDDHAAATVCSRSRSFAWMPPKPPLDMLST